MPTQATTSPIRLRALEASDLERTWQWHNSPELYETLLAPFRNNSHAAEAEWLQQRCKFSTTESNFAICLEGSGEHIGNIYLRAINWIAAHAEVGLFIGSPENRGKGYGAAALRAIMRHAFEDLRLHRLYMYLLADHPHATRTYEKCGFRVEGRLVDHAYKDGRFRDVLVMGVCHSPNSVPVPVQPSAPSPG